MKFAVMFSGFFTLLCDLRFEHRAVLVDDWRPWMPIIFCGIMLTLIPVAAYFWNRGGKQILMICYSSAVILGFVGLLFHSQGNFIAYVRELLSVWTLSLDKGSSIEAAHPPFLAPTAFIGLGLIGMLFCQQGKHQ